jgi:hypothetical protein
MKPILAFILGTTGEILLQRVGQALLEPGLYRAVDVLQRKKKNPHFTAQGYLLWGCALGGLTAPYRRQIDATLRQDR